MNTKRIAITITFATLTIVLNVIRIPAFYWPGYYYRIYEIPMVVAFMLFGARIGIAVTILNLFGQIFFFPVPVGFVGYPFGVLAVITMMLGVYLGNMLVRHRIKSKNFIAENSVILYLTAIGVAFRATIMPLLDYGLFYHFLMPIALGRTFTEEYLIGLVPSMVIFNVTVPLYTIPISYVIARKVAGTFKMDKQQSAAI
jgi:riboflavin transporter FmnP